MKKSKKLAKANEARITQYENRMNDPRISSTWKQSSVRPGSDKRK